MGRWVIALRVRCRATPDWRCREGHQVEACDDTEVITTALQCSKEVAVLLGAGGDDSAICQDYLHCCDVVGGEALAEQIQGTTAT